MIEQGPAVLAAGAGRVGCFWLLFFFFFFLGHLVYPIFLSNASSVGRRLDILKYFGLGRYNAAIVVSYYRRRAR